MKNNHSHTSTPLPNKEWVDMLPDYRDAMIVTTLHSWRNVINVVETKDNGHVILSFVKQLPADKRGAILLDIEEYLKDRIDFGLTVWLDPQEDKSSLRKLRGIEIKHD